MLFFQLVMNIEFELLKKLRCPNLSQVELYCQGYECNWQLLQDINDCQMICLDDDFCLRGFNWILHFLYYPHKAGNLQFYWPVILFGWNEESRKKKNWLRLTCFLKNFVRGCMENNYSKTKFFRCIQVYLQDFLRVMVNQSRGLTQELLNTQK